jgi:hypothetical protein
MFPLTLAGLCASPSFRYLREIATSANLMSNETLARSEFEGIRRFSIAYFLGILVLMIFASPFVGNSRGGAIVESILDTLVLLSAVLAVGGRLKMLIGLILAVPALLGDWLSYLLPHLPFPELFRTFGLLSSMARMLAITEAVFGMFYLTLMIARLVSLYSDRGSPDAVSRGRKVARRTGIRRL